MPVLTLRCPDCGHVYQGSVLQGTKPPETWVCSRCRAVSAARSAVLREDPHPWEISHAACRCCG